MATTIVIICIVCMRRSNNNPDPNPAAGVHGMAINNPAYEPEQEGNIPNNDDDNPNVFDNQNADDVCGDDQPDRRSP